MPKKKKSKKGSAPLTSVKSARATVIKTAHAQSTHGMYAGTDRGAALNASWNWLASADNPDPASREVARDFKEGRVVLPGAPGYRR